MTFTQLASPIAVKAQNGREKALQLRITGATYKQIAEKLNLSLSTVHGYVVDALDDLRERNSTLAQRVQDLDMIRLDTLLRGLWPKRKDPQVANTILRVLDQRAKLAGAYPVVRWEGSGAGGGIVPTSGDLDLRKLSMDQLRQLEAIVIAAGPKPLTSPSRMGLDPTREVEKPEQMP
jgi:hypothetical protein